MEWKVPSHCMPSATGPISGGDALAHLPGGLVGEGDGEDLERTGLAGGDQVGDPGREHAGLAGAGAGEHENGPFGRLHGGALLRVQAGQVGGLRRNRRSGAGAQGSGRRLVGKIVLADRVLDRTDSSGGTMDQKANGVEPGMPVDPAAG